MRIPAFWSDSGSISSIGETTNELEALWRKHFLDAGHATCRGRRKSQQTRKEGRNRNARAKRTASGWRTRRCAEEGKFVPPKIQRRLCSAGAIAVRNHERQTRSGRAHAAPSHWRLRAFVLKPLCARNCAQQRQTGHVRTPDRSNDFGAIGQV